MSTTRRDFVGAMAVATVVVVDGGVLRSALESQGTPPDFELQYRTGNRRRTIERVRENPKTIDVFTPTVRCMVDVFFSDRWIFQFDFPPASTAAIRRLVHNSTWGGSTNELDHKAGGQGWKNAHFCRREIRVLGA